MHQEANKKKPKRPTESRTKYEITPEKFVEIWSRAESAEEAAEEMGMPLPIVLARVSNYRKKGVRLKKMPRKNSRRVDVDHLNKIIDKILAEKG